MSLDRWRAILTRHGVDVKGGAEVWDRVSGEVVWEIYQEIGGIVEGTRMENNDASTR